MREPTDTTARACPFAELREIEPLPAAETVRGGVRGWRERLNESGLSDSRRPISHIGCRVFDSPAWRPVIREYSSSLHDSGIVRPVPGAFTNG